MSDDDLDYYRRRADIELRQAQHATDPKVCEQHARFASAYLELISMLKFGEPMGRA